MHGYPLGQPPKERNGPRRNRIPHPGRKVKPRPDPQGEARKGRGREPPGPEATRYPGAPSGGGRGGGAAGEKPGQPQRHRKRSSPDAHQRSAGRPARASGRSPPKSPGGRAQKRRPHGPPGPPGLEPAGPEARRDAPGGTRRGHAKRKGKAERSQGDQSSAAGARSEARPRPERSGASERPRSRKPRRSGAQVAERESRGGRRGARPRQAQARRLGRGPGPRSGGRGRRAEATPRRGGGPGANGGAKCAKSPGERRRSGAARNDAAPGQAAKYIRGSGSGCFAAVAQLGRGAPEPGQGERDQGPRPGPLPHLDLLGLKCRSCWIFRLRTPPCRVCDAPCVQGPSGPGRVGRKAHLCAGQRKGKGSEPREPQRRPQRTTSPQRRGASEGAALYLILGHYSVRPGRYARENVP